MAPFFTQFDDEDLDWYLFEDGPEFLEHIEEGKILSHDLHGPCQTSPHQKQPSYQIELEKFMLDP